MDYTTGCCDNDNSLPLNLFLPGLVFTGDNSTLAGRLKLRRPKYRPIKDRETLVKALVEWREKALDQHPHQAVITRGWILPNDTITALSKVCASDIRGPQTVLEVADRAEEWVSIYASDIHNIITRFDEENHVRKLCTQLSCGVVKKVRSATWQKRIRKRYEKNAEFALITAEGVVGDMAKFEKAVRKEKRLLVQRRTTADDMDEMKRRVDARRAELRWMLEDTIRNLQEHCESLREFVAWSDGLVEADGDEGEEGEEEHGNLRKTTLYLPPPVRRSSRQSI